MVLCDADTVFDHFAVGSFILTVSLSYTARFAAHEQDFTEAVAEMLQFRQLTEWFSCCCFFCDCVLHCSIIVHIGYLDHFLQQKPAVKVKPLYLQIPNIGVNAEFCHQYPFYSLLLNTFKLAAHRLFVLGSCEGLGFRFSVLHVNHVAMKRL